MSKIDAVITWVDGNDPDFIESKAKYLKKEKGEKGVQDFGLLETRFVNIGELKYCIKLIRKNLKFINKIFIFTNGQRPNFMNDEFTEQYGLILVDHETVFGQNYERFLPVFNSQSIEAMLARIPGLSEFFLYFNDDFFVAREMYKEDFFSNDGVVLHGVHRFKNKWLDRVHRVFDRQFYVGTVGLRRESNKFPKKLFYFSPIHAPYAIEKKMLVEAIEDWGGYEKIIKYKFRNEFQPWPIGLYINKMARENKIIYKPTDEIGYFHGAPNKKFDFILDPQMTMFSLQSLDTLPDVEGEIAIKFLKKLAC